MSRRFPRINLGLQVFLSVLSVALGSVLAVGLITRSTLAAAFDAYLATAAAGTGTGAGAGAGSGSGSGLGGGGMGKMMLGAAENTFLSTVDTSVIIGALAAIVVAGVVAVLLARHMSRPLGKLQTAAEGLSRGELNHRAEVSGPSEVAALGAAFNRMAGSLEEAEGLRQRLVADVSHELRNPIAAARAQAEGMADGVLVADPARLNSLVEDLQHLSALVDDLQVLATAEAGRLRYTMHTIDLAELVRRETERAAAGAPARTRVSFAGKSSAVWVTGDELRLSEVLRNLLSNAVRHTTDGTVVTSIEALPDGQAEIRVTDTGEGIPARDLPYVFERLYRADTARAAHTGGAGLGLAITRRIVEDHGGEVFATSQPGRQTVVGFRLARSAPPAAAARFL
ncbi:MAG: HAMP domain-containing histidine kinase [Coriobacteriia bacterium]|nr:HAMP domain-containing histidine kinase [Coriobacteriia bacterium]